MKPSIGRIVHFVLPEDQAPPEFVNGRHARPEDDAVKNHVPRWYRGEHCAALVVGVNADDTVNLHVFFNLPMFSFWDNVAEGVEFGTWHWPERED